jgi:hypothetical protein
MTYRNTLIERSRNFASENGEPAVLDYLQLRNRHCLQAWYQRRVKYALNAVAQSAQRPAADRTHRWWSPG